MSANAPSRATGPEGQQNGHGHRGCDRDPNLTDDCEGTEQERGSPATTPVADQLAFGARFEDVERHEADGEAEERRASTNRPTGRTGLRPRRREGREGEESAAPPPVGPSLLVARVCQPRSRPTSSPKERAVARRVRRSCSIIVPGRVRRRRQGAPDRGLPGDPGDHHA